MRSWGEARTCRASVIRDILRGRLVADPDPHGLRLRGARIVGRLDLESLTTGLNFELQDCILEEGVLARDAHLTFVGLIRCRLEHSSEPPLDADRLTCNVLTLLQATIIGYAHGAVSLRGAHIDRAFNCIDAEVRSDSGPALDADGLHVGQDVRFGGLTATGTGQTGAICLGGAHIGGHLECTDARLHNDSGPALFADGLQVGQAMLLNGAFTATGAGQTGAIRLLSAHIGSQLSCKGASLRNDSGPALFADGLQVDRDMFLTGGFTAIGGGEDGAVRLSGAHIGGSLQCDGAILRNDSGPGLRAFRLQVDGDMYLTGEFTATGSRDRGAVRLTGARIGGSLDCSGATLRNDSGPALLAYGIQVGQDIYLTRNFTATGAGERAVINLRTTRVGGAFDFKPKQLEHTDDSHNRLKVDGLTYTGLPGPSSDPGPNSGECWRDLLRHGTPGYTAQPYQQLAAGYRALGDDRRARQTLIAQRDDQLARTDTSWWERLWGR